MVRIIGLIVAGITAAFLILLAVAGICKVALEASDRLIGGPPQKVAIVQADFPVCVTVVPPPLPMPPSARNPYARKADNT